MQKMIERNLRILGDLDTFFLILTTQYNKMLYPRDSLIIFDEIQRFPKARQSIKKLVQDGRFDYIETGSLISVKENVKDITIPSEERKLKLYPMDFEEFCMALGESAIAAYIRNCYEKKIPLAEELHHKAMLLFRQYMIVGGMPRSIAVYLENGRSFQKADEEKRVVLSDIEKHGSFSNCHETFFWLSDSMIANECFNCSDPNVGLSLNEDRTYLKCYMGDTGLLISHTFDENELMEEDLYKQLLLGKLSVNEGMFFENAIAQELVSRGHKLFFYTHYNREKHRNDIEIDFLISNKSKTHYKMFPVEVKSSDHYKITSMKRFMEKYADRIGASYVIHPKNFKLEDGVVYLPAYMVMCL